MKLSLLKIDPPRSHQTNAAERFGLMNCQRRSSTHSVTVKLFSIKKENKARYWLVPCLLIYDESAAKRRSTSERHLCKLSRSTPVPLMINTTSGIIFCHRPPYTAVLERSSSPQSWKVESEFTHCLVLYMWRPSICWDVQIYYSKTQCAEIFPEASKKNCCVWTICHLKKLCFINLPGFHHQNAVDL